MAEVLADAVRYPLARLRGVTAEGRRQSGTGQRPGQETKKEFWYNAPATVWHGGTAETIPSLARAWVWDTDQATTESAKATQFDLTRWRWISFTIVGSGHHYICTQAQWASVVAAVSAIGLEYHTRAGWRRYQQVSSVVLPCLGSSPTIQLVAGANVWGVSTDTTYGSVDGALGTNRLAAPIGGVFGPDGRLYFMEQATTHIRYYDPATALCGITGVSRDRGAGYRDLAQVFTVGPDGLFYFYLNRVDDQNTQEVISVHPDNTFARSIYLSYPLNPILAGQISNIFVAPDNSTLYIPCPAVGYTTGAVDIAQYLIIGVNLSTLTPRYVAGTGDAGGFGIPTHQGGGSHTNDQGEDVPARTGEIGNALNCYVNVNGDLYTICNYTRMVRKVDAVTGMIRSITNHQPLDNTGGPVFGGFGGDGLAAFTLNDNSAQFVGLNSVTVDSCKNVFIGDNHFEVLSIPGGTHTSLVRYVDTGGILHTLAGQIVPVDNNMPDATPADALSKTFYNASWIAWGPDGSLYVMCSAGTDGVNYSANCIYRIASSH